MRWLTPKGRREQGRFIFEGATLLEEALAAGLVPGEAIATQAAYDRHRIAARWEERGVPVAIVSERTFAHLSDVTTPSGLLAAAPARLATLEVLLAPGEPVLVLAGIADPGNAGTLVPVGRGLRRLGASYRRRRHRPAPPQSRARRHGIALFRGPSSRLANGA